MRLFYSLRDGVIFNIGNTFGGDDNPHFYYGPKLKVGATVKMPREAYTGEALRPTPTVTVDGKALAKGANFSVS